MDVVRYTWEGGKRGEGLDLVFVKGTAGRPYSFGEEGGRLPVEIADFFIAATPVTQELWTRVMGADANPSVNRGKDLPVENVDRFARWFKAVRSRNAADLPVSPLDAHVSCAHCHLGNIAFRVGHSLAFDPKSERFKDSEMNRYLNREYRKGFEVPKLA